MSSHRGRAVRSGCGQSGENARRCHSRHTFRGSARVQAAADYVLGSLSEIPDLLRRVNATG